MRIDWRTMPYRQQACWHCCTSPRPSWRRRSSETELNPQLAEGGGMLWRYCRRCRSQAAHRSVRVRCPEIAWTISPPSRLPGKSKHSTTWSTFAMATLHHLLMSPRLSVPMSSKGLFLPASPATPSPPMQPTSFPGTPQTSAPARTIRIVRPSPTYRFRARSSPGG